MRSDVSFDDDDPLKTKSKPTPKFTPQALELGSSKAEDIEFEKWKSKVGRLDMNVREPLTLLRSSPSKQQQPRSDIYKLKDGHQKSGSRTVTAGSRDAAAAVADQHKDSQEQDDDVADASSSDDGDDDSDEVDQDGSDGSSNEGSGSDDDSFAELEKHSRKKKKKQKQQPPSRLMLVFKDIKQSVRSYSDVAKVIVELPAVAVDVAGKSASNSSENDDDDDDDEEEVSGRRKKKKGCSIS